MVVMAQSIALCVVDQWCFWVLMSVAASYVCMADVRTSGFALCRQHLELHDSYGTAHRSMRRRSVVFFGFNVRCTHMSAWRMRAPQDGRM